MELCTPRPKKKKKEKKRRKNKGGRRGRNGRRDEGKHGSDDSEESDSEEATSEEDDSDEGDSEEESKYSPSRSMDEMDAVEQQRVAVFNKIRRARFEAHNREWLKFARDEEKMDDDDGYRDPRYNGGQDQYGSDGAGQYRDGGGHYEGSEMNGRGGAYPDQDDLDDSGQWMVGSGRHENIAVDMALLGGDDWESGDVDEGKSYY